MDERMARMGLTCVVDPAQPSLASLLETYGVEELWQMLRSGRGHVGWAKRAASVDFAELERQSRIHGLRFVAPGDDDWPESVNDLSWGEQVNSMGGAPIGLWVSGQGSLARLSRGSVAIVGSRASSYYGDDVAHQIAYDLATAGVAVVSGGAYGVDSAAHRGALAGAGTTISVMAGGLVDVYPSGNRKLLDQVRAEGLLVSELPPGATPTRARFLTRNRLIAALSIATVLVEAAMRSGARNTVSWAQSVNRMVLAVPGPVTSQTSATPHRLIRNGEAILVASGQEVLDLVRPLSGVEEAYLGESKLFDSLSAEQKCTYEALPARSAVSAEEVSFKSGLALRTVLVALQSLARQGLVSAEDGFWRLERKRL